MPSHLPSSIQPTAEHEREIRLLAERGHNGPIGESGHSVGHHCAMHGDSHVLRLWLAHGGDPALMNTHDQTIGMCCRTNDVFGVWLRSLRDHPKRMDLIRHTDMGGFTIGHLAHHHRMLAQWCHAGGDINTLTHRGESISDRILARHGTYVEDLSIRCVSLGGNILIGLTDQRSMRCHWSAGVPGQPRDPAWIVTHEVLRSMGYRTPRYRARDIASACMSPEGRKMGMRLALSLDDPSLMAHWLCRMDQT